MSFELNQKIKTQCIAIDYVFKNKQPLMVEISYGFSPGGYDSCEGYWDKNIIWHAGPFNPYGWMIEDLVK
jgi:hypothetical protein